MLSKKRFIFFVVIINIIIFICSAINVWAQEDEAATFNSLAPDALVILDLSGSMAWNPAGGDEQYGNSLSCVADTTHCTGSGCTGGFCGSSKTNCTVKCSRLDIAKRALFGILDDNNDNTIDSNDSTSLNIRIGFMRLYNCSSDITLPSSWTSSTTGAGCATLVRGIGTKYSQIYCNNTTSCASTATGCSPSGECIVGEQASGGTPLASTLKLAKQYLDYNKSQDNAKACRLKFVILITDGADTYGCSGDGGECQGQMYERRREVVAAAKQLADAGYKVFVVGFGVGMPSYLQNTLNWMAYYGGTDNPLVDNAGSTTGYNIAIGCNAHPAVPAACCKLTTNPTACYPVATPAITSCHSSTDQQAQPPNNTPCYSGGTTAYPSYFRTTSNDPGYLALSGYAFLAENADDLTEALKTALSSIRDATYSFTQVSVQAVRTVDENYLYAASFQPLNYDPFWPGHLIRYSINTDGTISGTVDWDTGDVLSNTTGTNRTIWTYKAGALIAFNSTNLLPADLGVTTTTARDMITNFIINGENSDDVTAWKLGDIFHTSPLSIASPNSLFTDRWDTSNPKAFKTYSDNHQRSSANGKRIILVGDNAGQLHAVKTGALSGTIGGGSELWSFIPPNLLPQLTYIAHSTHPSSLIHKYFVDGPLSAAEIWLGISGSDISHTAKSVNDWHTYFVMSEGRGGGQTLWSSSPYCASGFSPSYSSTYANYCGNYAFDISDTASNPVFKWRLGGNSGLSATDGAHLGQSWSKMFIGRVLINNTEKWVGLIGGGFSGINCPVSGACDTRGKGFYVVDLSNGSILWRYTHSGPTAPYNGSMDFDLAAGPVGVDYDNDGFLDTAYIGDTGGNIWRFKFCLAVDATSPDPMKSASCNTTKWSGGLLFSSPSTSLSIYSTVAVTMDQWNNLWVYSGTGDRTDPTSINATQERLYAVKDSDRSTGYNIGNLVDITSTTYTDSSTGHGWYFRLPGTGEKILSEPVLFEQNVYFTTFTPPDPNNPCDQSGDAKMYVVNYITGGGQFTGSARSENIGSGIPNAPVISRNPTGGTDIYVSTSQSGVIKPYDPTVWKYQPNNLLYWRDTRIQ